MLELSDRVIDAILWWITMPGVHEDENAAERWIHAWEIEA